MDVRRKRTTAPARHVGANRPFNSALDYARNIYAASDRRMPEGRALAMWLGQTASALGLAEAAVPDDEALHRTRRGSISLRDWHKIGAALDEAEACQPRRRNDRWLAKIARTLSLDRLETEILSLALQYHLDLRIERLFDHLSDCRGRPTRLQRDAALIALLLKASAAAVDSRLAPDAKLQASGLLRVERHGELQALERVTALMRRDILPEADLYDQLLGKITAEPLPWDAFAHLGRQAEVAASVLRAALVGHEIGVNILLYGPPGTGKTSFAAALAAQVGANLRPVVEADEDGGEPTRHERLAGLRLAQRLVASRNTLLLFDEAEDLFVDRSASLERTPPRVFIHRVLEQLTVPVIWTANDISALGPAVLRRMTMCLELRIPSVLTRTRLWREMGQAEGVALSEPDAARLARLVPAAPAVAATALRATRLAGGSAETARLVVEGVARAVNGGALPAPEPEHDAAYDPTLVNADCDLVELLERLSCPGAQRAVSFLLSGPPGTGKSAWVRYFAERMGLQTLQKRASDLLNPFLGGTERNIANAFAEARDANAFLVFDEADSLLLDRADAVRSWEISQVNEMLTWMEQHRLPFACTTNLPDRLDRASLRRFLVKVRFDWLTQVQARSAFQRFFGQPAPIALGALRTLTPADFALVRRRAAVIETAEPEELVRLLAAECEDRIGCRLPIGFMTRVTR